MGVKGVHQFSFADTQGLRDEDYRAIDHFVSDVVKLDDCWVRLAVRQFVKDVMTSTDFVMDYYATVRVPEQSDESYVFKTNDRKRSNAVIVQVRSEPFKNMPVKKSMVSYTISKVMTQVRHGYFNKFKNGYFNDIAASEIHGKVNKLLDAFEVMHPGKLEGIFVPNEKEPMIVLRIKDGSWTGLHIAISLFPPRITAEIHQLNFGHPR
jgi:hypothetical protein